MGIMAGFVMWWSLLSLSMLLGFGYIVWVLASKETGKVRLLGELLAVAIVILSLILFGYGAVNGRAMKGRGCPMMGRGMMGKGMMMEGKEGRKMEKMMEKCKDMKKDMKREMKKEMRKEKK